MGRTLPGGYRIVQLVGVGGMGRVYCAEQVALGRTVAVKVVHPHLSHEDLAVSRFFTEARASSRLAHPNAVSIFDFGRTDDGHPYIVMEFLRGRDLGQVADAEGPLGLRRIVDVLCQTLGALHEAHALGIVHRDLKPDNIVLEPLRSGIDFVKVVDFGLAKMHEQAPPPAGQVRVHTRPGFVCGTPEYMSPEQGRGDPLDGRSDLYSVGVVLYELLSGRVPLRGDTATKTLLMHLQDPPPDPRAVSPERGIPEAFALVALRALAKNRDDRFPDARAFSEALETALAEVQDRLRFDSQPRSAIRCRTCGAVNPLGQKFCGECGASIRASAQMRTMPPSPTHPTMPQTRAPSAVLATPLLGRDDVLSWLEARRHEAGAMLASAHIVGEAGMGKTRIVREMVARCAARGDHVVCIGPDPAWAKIGDTAVREAIVLLACEVLETRERANEQARLGLDVLFDEPPQAPTGAARRRAVAEALRWALERAGERVGRGAVVLAVDDLDFIDGTSRNALVDLVSEPPVVPALVLLAYASGTYGEPLAGETWTLAPLARESMRLLVAPAMLATGAAFAPLHVEQLVAWSRETAEPPPERLADLVVRRAERLPADARHALHAIAVWGDDATAETVRRMLPPSVDVAAAMDALDRARLVAVDAGGLRIAHPLVRRIVFSGIPLGHKAELFARAAEMRPGAPLEIRARQAMYGGGVLQALALLDQLAARRASHGDTPGAISALRHALDVARRDLARGELDDPIGATLVFARKLADALAAADRWDDAEGVAREALGNTPPASEHTAKLLGTLARVAHARRQTAEAQQYIAEAKRIAHQSDARELIPVLERIEREIAVA